MQQTITNLSVWLHVLVKLTITVFQISNQTKNSCRESYSFRSVAILLMLAEEEKVIGLIVDFMSKAKMDLKVAQYRVLGKLTDNLLIPI